MTKIRLISLFITVLIALGLTYLSSLESVQLFSSKLGYRKEAVYSRPVDSEKKLHINLNFNSGEFNITPFGERNDLYYLKALYKLREIEPQITYFQETDPELNINLKLLQRLGLGSKSHWTLDLNPAIAYSFNIQSKHTKQYINLTEIPISQFNLSTNTGHIYMYINKNNPIEMSQFNINLGAANCKIFGILNSRADYISIRGAAANLRVDFSKKLNKTIKVKISNGLGRTKLIIPNYLNTRIVMKNRLPASFKIDQFQKKSKNEYVNPTYDPKKEELLIMLTLGTGQLIINSSNK